MAANVAVAQDPVHLKPAKDKCTERIDGMSPLYHGHRPRDGRSGRAPARVLHVLCLKAKAPTPSPCRATKCSGPQL